MDVQHAATLADCCEGTGTEAGASCPVDVRPQRPLAFGRVAAADAAMRPLRVARSPGIAVNVPTGPPKVRAVRPLRDASRRPNDDGPTP